MYVIDHGGISERYIGRELSPAMEVYYNKLMCYGNIYDNPTMSFSSSSFHHIYVHVIVVIIIVIIVIVVIVIIQITIVNNIDNGCK